MKILALDTSTELCSVALWLDGAAVFRDCFAGQRHSQLILPMVDEVLHAAGVTLNDLRGIAFGAGPGSFTGLRIGCGVAQGLAFGAGLPVIGVSTLEALAQSSGQSKVIAAMDARMGEIYHAAYTHEDGELRTVIEPSLCRPGAAPMIEGTDWTGVGSGFASHGELLLARYHGILRGTDSRLFPHAKDIAYLAVRAFARGEGVSAENAAPIYLREKVALTTAERKPAA
jgi:tRNA threonylcarbamoyladenosine biosynthesis protein TsaB